MADQNFVDRFGDLLLYGGKSAIDEHFGYKQQPTPYFPDAGDAGATLTATTTGTAAPNESGALGFVRDNQNAILLGVGGLILGAVVLRAVL